MHSLHVGDAKVIPTGPGILEENSTRSTFLFCAVRPHEGLIPHEAGEVILTDEMCQPLQAALETFANLLAIQYRTSRRLMSPWRYAAVEPLDDEGIGWLRGMSGIKHETTNYPLRMYPHFDADKHLTVLKDRLDGVSLLAEALCHNHSTGRLHDLMRVFERAFRTGPTRVCKQLLPAFLAPSGYGFTTSEVEGWLHLRDTSVHADQRLEFATQADTTRIINRVEQAAYDVLFNKLDWRSPSLTRREAFQPAFASADKQGINSILVKGRDLVMEFSPHDGFGAYPLCMRKVDPKIPDGWLAAGNPPSEGDKLFSGGTMSVHEEPAES